MLAGLVVRILLLKFSIANSDNGLEGSPRTRERSEPMPTGVLYWKFQSENGFY